MLKKLYECGCFDYRKYIIDNQKVLALNSDETIVLINMLDAYKSNKAMKSSELIKISGLTKAKCVKALNSLFERSFYEKECGEEHWGVRELKRQMKSMLFHRLALSIDKTMKTINLGNNLYKSNRIYIDNNYNKPYYSRKNSYIIRSPTINANKKMTFINDKNVGCPRIIYDYDRMRGGKIEKFLEKKKSDDDKYIIGTTLSKKVYDKMNKINGEIEIFVNEENDEEKDKQFRVTRNFGDNYKYLERNEIRRSPCKYEKTFHFRRNPVHVYGHQNYIIKDNKKILIKTLPKGKTIRLYRNNNNCNREVKTIENRKFDPVTNSQQCLMTFPRKF